MLGPWPSALVIQGAKVTALVVYRGQWWRLLTPLLLHAGLIHLVVNLGIQLRIGACALHSRRFFVSQL
jgi:membrane associated rhomboid family serine protease